MYKWEQRPGRQLLPVVRYDADLDRGGGAHGGDGENRTDLGYVFEE